jgi:hypothetical protein
VTAGMLAATAAEPRYGAQIVHLEPADHTAPHAVIGDTRIERPVRAGHVP